MRYGIFSDIHANLEALYKVIEFFKKQKIDCFICPGDIVGYGPNPNECVNIVRELSPILLVSGNHDRAVCGLKDITWFNEYAQRSIKITQRLLTEQNKIFLSELPKILTNKDLTVVHGSPRDPIDEYLLTPEQYNENIPFIKTRITIIGHSHIPIIFSSKGIHSISDSDIISISDDEQNIIINVGSVGQPRDSDNRASCGILDTETKKIEIFKLEYQFQITQKKMKKLKLPAFLIERLSWGV